MPGACAQSTLLLQVAALLGSPAAPAAAPTAAPNAEAGAGEGADDVEAGVTVLYVSAEESVEQVRRRGLTNSVGFWHTTL